MNRKSSASWLKAVAGASALALVLAACGSDDDGNGGGGDGTAADDFTNDTCASGTTSADTLKVGAILPLTGSLAYLGPPEVAGVGLAVSDINAAGVEGITACHDIKDSGDSTNMSVSTNSAQELIASNPSVIVGAASSSVSLNFVDSVVDSEIVQISPANTSAELSGYSPFFFRTAPEDSVQGSALGSLIAQDGHQRIAFVVFNDTYGTGLRDFTETAYEAAGGEVVYGGKGDGDEFPAGQTTFSAEVTGALNANPDAIVVIAFDETKAILPELQSQGWDMSKVYMSDGNTADYSADFEPGTLEGAKGTVPGADPDQGFKDRLNGFYEFAENESLSDYVYGAESYDAVILGALAAIKGGSTEPTTIQENVAAVSGATDGEECSTFTDCAELLADGSEIKYAGPSGIGPLNSLNDPNSAFVGIYQYDNDNKNQLVDSVEGLSANAE